MPAVDYERAWLRLKEHILEKRSHGAGELAEAMAAIEVESAVPEGEEGFDPTPAPRHHPQEPALGGAGDRAAEMATH